MTLHRIARPTASLAVLALLAGACSDDDGPDDAQDPVTAPTDDLERSTTTTAAEPTDDTDGTNALDGDAPITAADGVLSDGLWAVGDAGTVEFAVTEGGLELIEVVAADGWEATTDEDSPDEIEVDFRQGEREYEIEIEYENGILEIEIDLDIDPAEPGPFELGTAGVAELAVDGGSVVLTNLEVAEGWSVTEQDTSDGEVEVELRRSDVVWELDAEMDDGRLEVEIDFEIEGAYP